MNHDPDALPRADRVALRARDGAVRLLEHAYEDAAIQGLCGEGALEYALDRLRHADADELLAPVSPGPADHDDTQKEKP